MTTVEAQSCFIKYAHDLWPRRNRGTDAPTG